MEHPKLPDRRQSASVPTPPKTPKRRRQSGAEDPQAPKRQRSLRPSALPRNTPSSQTPTMTASSPPVPRHTSHPATEPRQAYGNYDLVDGQRHGGRSFRPATMPQDSMVMHSTLAPGMDPSLTSVPGNAYHGNFDLLNHQHHSGAAQASGHGYSDPELSSWYPPSTFLGHPLDQPRQPRPRRSIRPHLLQWQQDNQQNPASHQNQNWAENSTSTARRPRIVEDDAAMSLMLSYCQNMDDMFDVTRNHAARAGPLSYNDGLLLELERSVREVLRVWRRRTR